MAQPPVLTPPLFTCNLTEALLVFQSPSDVFNLSNCCFGKASSVFTVLQHREHLPHPIRRPLLRCPLGTQQQMGRVPAPCASGVCEGSGTWAVAALTKLSRLPREGDRKDDFQGDQAVRTRAEWTAA